MKKEKEKTKSLYEICNEIDQLECWIDEQASENQGVIPEKALEYFNALEGEKNDKLENVYKAIINKQYFADILRTEEKRLAARRKVLENSCEYLENLVSMAIGTGNNFQSGIASFGWRTSKSVEIIDETLIPDTFASYSRTINKTAIKQMIESGIDVEGAKLIINNNLQVK